MNTAKNINNLTSQRFTKQNIFFFTALTASISILIALSFTSLSNLPTYWNKDEYSHGYLIPLIAALLCWHELVKEKPTPQSSWHGLLWLGASLAVTAFAELSASEAFLNYAFIIGLFGISYCYFGTKFTKAIFPALFFLFYAAPLPHIIYGNISIQMQLISSSIGTSAIQAAGFTVFQEGNIIDLGHMKLQVEEACNGLRYLFPLMSLGYIAAYLMESALWKRLLIMVSVIPITIIMNSMRIAAVGITVNIWGQEMAEGVLHTLEGFVVFGICLLFLCTEIWLILKFSKNDRFKHEYLTLPQGSPLRGKPKLALPSTGFLICAIIGFAAIFSLTHMNRTVYEPTTPNLSFFPLEISNWQGKRDFLTAKEIEVLDLTDYWMANYSTQETQFTPVNFYVAYYNSQRMRANIHLPLNCILGSGWQVDQQSSLSIETAQGSIPVARLLIRKGNQTGLVYYWLEQRGRRLSNPLKAKLYMIWDSITKNRTDGALVRVSTPLSSAEMPQKADERLQEFINTAYPKVEEFIPGK